MSCVINRILEEETSSLNLFGFEKTEQEGHGQKRWRASEQDGVLRKSYRTTNLYRTGGQCMHKRERMIERQRPSEWNKWTQCTYNNFFGHRISFSFVRSLARSLVFFSYYSFISMYFFAITAYSVCLVAHKRTHNTVHKTHIHARQLIGKRRKERQWTVKSEETRHISIEWVNEHTAPCAQLMYAYVFAVCLGVYIHWLHTLSILYTYTGLCMCVCVCV